MAAATTTKTRERTRPAERRASTRFRNEHFHRREKKRESRSLGKPKTGKTTKDTGTTNLTVIRDAKQQHEKLASSN